MATKRRPLHTSKLNFRPSFSDANSENRGGTKPTSGSTPVREIFILMILYLCKKSLFFDVNLKVAIYLGTLFLVSLIGDAMTLPKMYLSRSDNVFNRYFVKFAWAWNLTLVVPFAVFTAYIYCCGDKRRIVRDHLLRILVATFAWYTWTNMFNVIEAAFGRCAMRNFTTKESCLKNGYLWNGFDISGHTFILIYGSLFLIEEARSIENWDSIKEHLRLETHHRSTRDPAQNINPLRHLTDEQLNELQRNYTKYTPYIRGLFVAITAFQLLWDVMLVSTMLYYHVMIEKFLGGAIAILTWFVTYRLWYAHPKLIPKLPGEGVFRYIKKKAKEQPSAAAASRRRTGSIVNGRGPSSTVRPPNVQQQRDSSQEDASTE